VGLPCSLRWRTNAREVRVKTDRPLLCLQSDVNERQFSVAAGTVFEFFEFRISNYFSVADSPQ
jgi:hypothetical protein